MFDTVFASLATAFSEQFGGPYAEGYAEWPGTATYDTGGSITAAGTPARIDCRVQVDVATEAMRQAEGFLATDVRLLVIGLAALDDSAKIGVTAGTFSGSVYRLLSVSRDPAGIGFECRGRRV